MLPRRPNISGSMQTLRISGGVLRRRRTQPAHVSRPKRLRHVENTIAHSSGRLCPNEWDQFASLVSTSHHILMLHDHARRQSVIHSMSICPVDPVDCNNMQPRAAPPAAFGGGLTTTSLRCVQEMLPVIDAFDAAAGQVKVETEGEKKIAESYQVRCAGLLSALWS